MARLYTFLLLLITSPGFSQWYTVNTGVTGSFEGVFLTDSTNIFIIGEVGVSVASHDGGANWTPNFTGYVDDQHGIYFPTCDTGYVTADDEQVLKSTDGGYTWVLQSTPATDGLYGIFFVDGFYGYAVGKSGNIIHTTNGGLPWLLQTSGTTARLEEVFFTSYNNGHVVGRNDVYLRTTNGGTNWTVYNNLTGTGEDLKDVHFTDANTGYIVGGAGIIYKTTNAGLNWTALNSGVATDLNAVHFVSANIGYVAGDAGVILKTTNAGATWTIETTPTTNNLNDIHFGDPNNGYAVGALGTVIAIHAPNLPPPSPSASFHYNGPYCQGDPDPSPVFTSGSSSGNFSAIPAGLSINGSTGVIDLSASAPGTYTVTDGVGGNWSLCTPGSQASTQVTVLPTDDPTFSYPNSMYCTGGANPTPTVVTSGGTFTATPAGIAINSSTGQIDLTASTAGTYSITYTTNGTCPDNSTISITISDPPDPTFSYSGPYCPGDPDPQPQYAGGAIGGTFTATPNGLVINASTGVVDLSASTPGTYTVTNTIAASGGCAAVSHQVQITINALDDATFGYNGTTTFCSGGNDPTPTITTPGGTFSATPSGLVMDAGTGVIDLSASNTGNYDITYTTNGPCPNTFTLSISITGAPDATFSYSGPYCPTDPDPQPQLGAGATGGIYSATPSGLVINSATGLIDLSASAPGTYTITNTIAASGGCPAVSYQAQVTINPLDDPAFNYPGTTFCLGGSNPSPTVVTNGGTFTASPNGITINSTTGEIDLASSATGTYNITYTTNGTCPDDSTITITLTNAPDPTFSFGGPYCPTDPDPQPQLAAGAVGGIYTASPSGISLDPNSGIIDLSASTPGTYTVTNTVAASGGCPAVSHQVQVIINPLDDASFYYSGTAFCTGSTNPTPTMALQGGVFGGTPTGIVINTSTGEIDLTASAAGTYNITYTTNGACPNDSTIAITISDPADPTFSFGGPYCPSDPDPQPQYANGAVGGTFTASPSGLVINASTGVIDLSASAPGTYTVTNTIAASSPCPAVTHQAQVTIDPQDDATFNYGGSTFCSGGSNPLPTVTTTGGTFTSTPAGIVINSATGEIDLSGSTAGTYNITYTTNGTCPDASTISITITTAPDATFGFGGPYCPTDPDPQPQFPAGASGGTFSASPAGLVINPSTGLIDLSASTPGTYTITNTIAASGSCPAVSAQAQVIINTQDDATFNYGGSTFCSGGTNPLPTVTTTGGTFTASPAGIVINSATGEIDLSGSTAGTYNITYTTNGTCPDASTISITITTAPDATFSFGGPYCPTDPDPQPQFPAGASGGTFSASPAGLVINPSTGLIDLSASAPGTYTITNTIAASGSCPAVSAQAQVTIDPQDDATFNYGGSTFCSGGSNPLPTVTTTGGTFTSTPAGIVINSATGEIDLSNSTASTYSITYTTNGTCPDASTISITITTAPDATFSFGGPYCPTDPDPQPQFPAGASGGTFSAIPAGLVINTSTGLIDLSASTPGTYTITNTIAASGSCPAVSAQAQVIINAQDDATFSYSSSSFCSGVSNPIPTIATTGGLFTAAPSGMVINSGTGEIDLSATVAGSYLITYITNGACPDTANATVSVSTPADPTFTLGGPYCLNDPDPQPQFVSGTVAGNFTAIPAGLVLDASTGVIDLSASTSGTYTVTNTISSSGPCPAVSHSVQVTVLTQDDPTFGYGTSTFCSGGTNPTPSITTPGGTFVGTPSGISVNSSTGVIDLANSATGTYNITYTTNGACPASSTISITITTSPDAAFTYTGPYCPGDPDPQPQFVAGASGGTFSASPAGLSINAGTGIIDLSTSNPGTYTVTNTIPASGSCPAVSAQAQVTINAQDDATFSYSNSTYCTGGADPSPTVVTSGGSFSATPSGLMINGTTGKISLSASSVGSYTITYTTNGPCPAFASVTLNIVSAPDATFSFGGPYCPSDPDPQPQLGPGASAGSFSATPAGLVINSTTGEIDVSASSPGMYTVTNTLAASGSCPAASYQVQVTINPSDDATFGYAGGTFCQGGNNPIPTVTTLGGSFSATPNGITINATTGEIDLASSSNGNYSITYTTNGPCPASATASITITTSPDATFTYGGPYCQADPDPQPQFGAGASAGTFSASPSGLVINSTTGVIDLSASTPGTYTITNAIAPSGGCPASSYQAQITINPLDDATFSYPADSFCFAGTNPIPTVTNPGGSFSASPAGLNINTTTGEIDLLTSTVGSYLVTYTTNGQCPASHTVDVTIEAMPAVTLAADTLLCESDDPIILTGTPAGGTFSGPGISGNEFDPKQTGTGTFIITYQYTNASGCSSSTSMDIEVQSHTVDAGPDQTIMQGQQAILNASGNGVTWLWSPANTLSCPTCQSTTAMPETTMTYTVTSTNAAGCLASDEVIISVEGQIIVPNAFSPNGDGRNDRFIIPFLDVLQMHFSIYNRWGDLVFFTTDPAETWEGTYQGVDQDVGVYAYILKAEMIGGGVIVKKGNITLLR